MSKTSSEIWLAGGSDEAYWTAWWAEVYGTGHPGGWDECMCCPLPDDETETTDD